MSFGKRMFDIVCSTLGLLLLSPVFLLVSLLILVGDGKPVFFSQERIGYRGRAFRICKFRTMVRDAESLGKPLTVGRDARITRIGRRLRKYKLDELPQLFNVLRGEMSLVGPRPEVSQYVRLYSREQRKILGLMPGITDPASIAYSDESRLLANLDNPEQYYIEFVLSDKIRRDLEYAANATLWSDLMVLIKTARKILNIEKRSDHDE